MIWRHVGRKGRFDGVPAHTSPATAGVSGDEQKLVDSSEQVLEVAVGMVHGY